MKRNIAVWLTIYIACETPLFIYGFFLPTLDLRTLLLAYFIPAIVTSVFYYIYRQLSKNVTFDYNDIKKLADLTHNGSTPVTTEDDVIRWRAASMLRVIYLLTNPKRKKFLRMAYDKMMHIFELANHEEGISSPIEIPKTNNKDIIF